MKIAPETWYVQCMMVRPFMVKEGRLLVKGKNYVDNEGGTKSGQSPELNFPEGQILAESSKIFIIGFLKHIKIMCIYISW